MQKPEQRGAVLCATADPHIRAALETVLSDYETVFVPNGFEALSTLNRRYFHAHVLDFWLPDWSGLQLCKHIRRSDPRVPIIICAGAQRDEDRARAFRAHASAYFCAPIDVPALTRKLHDLVEFAALESKRALADGQRSLDAEIRTRIAAAGLPLQVVRESFGPVIERTARNKARTEYLKAGGTLAHFEAAWASDMSSAWARVEADSVG